MPNTPDSVYDYYDITDIIGEGTFSTVGLATHKFTNEKYAVKVISKDCLDKQKRSYVDWEISILTKCSHPNIVDFIEYFESDEDICLVLEWVSNGDLFERIVKKGVFTEEEARLTMISILSAVEYLHDRSIAHRDIKPENILFNNERGDVKLADFGLSKFYDESTGLDSACGTPAYSAPEISSNQVYRKSVDMWSVGCILYFILYGKPPFYSDDESTICRLVSKGEWSFPSVMAKNHSLSVQNLIKGLLDRDPVKRLTVKQALNHDWITQSQSMVLEYLSTIQEDSISSTTIDTTNRKSSILSSSSTKPISIKQSLLRSSLNSSVEYARGYLTPPNNLM
ncbi:hypothetical protein CYY_002650 [Polysphondylium violaceum]|uniref:non-specific serine/threonine protein kinase n=1 Tax=Polysphondylium violaceum TaxID=133409 RepID=A0A8J4UUX8_9MYCE|nr:hypothetical protein CYY_002650 [Polysphondylium violaceum]